MTHNYLSLVPRHLLSKSDSFTVRGSLCGSGSCNGGVAICGGEDLMVLMVPLVLLVHSQAHSI